MENTEAEQRHADLVDEHISSLEAIKAEVVEVENYEAAEVIAKTISFIKSAYIANHNMAKEVKSIKNNLRMRIAVNAMSGLLMGGRDSFIHIAGRAFDMADKMLAESKK